MKVTYQSYREFILKAEVLSRALGLNQQEASELLARVSGYDCLAHMPLARSVLPAPPRAILVHRFVTLRPDLSPDQAVALVDQMNFLIGPDE